MKLDKTTSKTTEFGFYALFLIVPLIFIPGHFELFQFNKMIAVYLGTTIITSAWIIRMVSQGRIFVRRTPLDIPILLFLLSQIASTLISIEPHTSIWGYYSRFHGGLLSTISYILLYYAFVSNYPTPSEGVGDKFVQASWTRLKAWLANRLRKITGVTSFEAKRISVTRTRATPFAESVDADASPSSFILILLTSATVVSIYGILEHFGIDEHYWIQDVRNRVFSTMGQPNWLAAFLVTITPLSFILPFSLQQRQKESGPDKFSLGATAIKSIAARVANFAGYLGQALGLASQSVKKSILDRTVNSQKIAATLAESNPIKRISVARASFLRPQVISLILTAIFYLTLLYTKSRSGLLGFAVMYIIFWGLRLLIRKHSFYTKQFLKTSAAIIIISLIIGTPFTPSFGQIFKKIQSTKAQPTPAVIPQSQSPPLQEGSPSEEIRKIVWKGAIDIWKNWPIFGSGVETFAYSYYNFRPLEHNFVSEWDFLYNKAHNEYLNFLATTGIVGLGSYLLLQAWFVVWCLKVIFSHSSNNESLRNRITQLPSSSGEGLGDKFSQVTTATNSVTARVANFAGYLGQAIRLAIQTSEKTNRKITVSRQKIAATLAETNSTKQISVARDRPTTSLLIALLSGYAGLSVTNFFGFSTVTTGLLFFMFPAFAVLVADQNPRWFSIKLIRKKKKKLILSQYISLALVLILFLFLLFQISKRWYADRLFAKGKSLSNANQMSQALLHMQRASTLVPDEPIFHNRLALDYARSAVALYLSDEATNAAQFIEITIAHSDLTMLQNPVHINYLKNRAATMLHLSTIDDRFRVSARDALLRAQELAPTDPNIPHNLGLLYQQEGKLQKALAEQIKAVELKPDYERARIALARVYEKLNQPEKAMEQYQAMLSIDPQNPTAQSALNRLATMSGAGQ